MKCDTCGKESNKTRRVLVDEGYDRSLALPLYNCPECFEKKEKARLKRKDSPREGSSPA